MSATRVLRWGVITLAALALSSMVYAGAVAAHDSGGHSEGPSGPTYNVTFSETGLAAGTNWSVSVGGWGFGHQQLTSSNSSITLSLPNGSYRYHVHGVPGYTLSNDSRGLVNVSGAAPPAIAVVYAKIATYTVTFQETGLPAGSNWSVRLSPDRGMWGGFSGSFWRGEGFGHGGLSGSSNTSSIVFQLPNGSYRYHAWAFGAHGSNTTRGEVNVSGAPVTVAVAFSSSGVHGATYSVKFQETGLPAGTNWSVRVVGDHAGGFEHGRHRGILTTSNASQNVSLRNGSYRYAVFPVPGYVVANNGSRGAFNVTGAPVTIDIVFQPLVTYTVTFTETGLPAGTLWSVAAAGSGSSSAVGPTFAHGVSNTTTITLALPNGSYFYWVGHVPGYSAGNTSFGSFNITGASPAAISVVFTAGSSWTPAGTRTT